MTTYYCPGAGKIRARRMTLAARIRLWKRRRHQDDLFSVRNWG